MRTVEGNTIHIRGALASLDLLARAIESTAPPSLSSIFALDWDRFVKEPQSTVHYAACAWLVRYLLDSRSGLADSFRSFLREVARGAPGEQSDLERALGRQTRRAVFSDWLFVFAWVIGLILLVGGMLLAAVWLFKQLWNLL